MKLEDKIQGKRTGKLGKKALYTAAVLAAVPYAFIYGKISVEFCKEFYYSFTSSKVVETHTGDSMPWESYTTVYGFDSDKNGSIDKIEVVKHKGYALGALFGWHVNEYTSKDKEFKHYYQLLMEKKK